MVIYVVKDPKSYKLLQGMKDRNPGVSNDVEHILKVSFQYFSTQLVYLFYLINESIYYFLLPISGI